MCLRMNKMATMTSFRNRLTQLEARLKAENDQEGESRNTASRALRTDVASSRPTIRGLPIGQEHGSPGRSGRFPSQRSGRFPSQRSACLPLSLPPCNYSPTSHDSTNHHMESKLKKIYQHAGILTIDGETYQSSIDDMIHMGELGTGTCGHVVKMEHRPSRKIMAVKQMRRSGNTEENKRITMDLDVVLSCQDCPHIVQCFGYFITDSDVWICMELMSTCLDKLIKRLKKPIPEMILGKIAVATVNALHYLKEKHGVIHRDVKPSNILLDERGVIKLCDFGISGRLVDSKARTRSAGCAAYMAPERIDPPNPSRPDYDIRADVWSLGISLVELATNRFPYQGCNNDFEVLSKVLQEDPPHLPPDGDFSLDFCSFVRDCLIKDFEKRPKYRKLLEHPFIKRMQTTPDGVAAWFAFVMKTTQVPVVSPLCRHWNK
ncbi:dual specificity mitogen-activated protein kinase kinase 7-like isoform X2 [Limulus polyphemus]|uniref:mitogen-activated protein kinase kinase n=1 Tax=Limulus polyphemus TaxID=6850 RepID=A0ABM1BQQ3_LIMPO|nr:dual specificity mitogen-activated protein kinase kinase 7-like isoform X2 [Limulus polyphemus]